MAKDFPDKNVSINMEMYSHFSVISAPNWYEVLKGMKKNGTPTSYTNSQIASIALANNMILVTRNTKDFEPIQKKFSLGVVNWFEE